MHPFTKDLAGICGEDVSTLVLEPDEQAPARARRFVAERFAAWGCADDHTGRTIVSELVTNALLHGEGPIVLRVFRDERDGLPTVEVWDGGAGRPVLRQENLTSIGGRGLLMVAALALDWGTRPLVEGGKLTWAKCGL
ncbi:anti-sigma regulatory factor (Ser/Thr protein kinase) [Actinomadura luteofluorescens]|uniref:Anti-sigma regulatory factor (Ser/Thr protein kinase) n=1 Tax=Actinomadura luteofluorescens TaxID=46163 RepID=A0A7Y9EJS5_9ACTN|nr:ATP-binding protein [Actinomadura luteofluorescens]NYD48974.1 anti-sigma regulatory factor (Ser/Thr protein kinase) [Actinomadura luteofluorescens]